jgi:ABC-type transporter Mla subunit MlaD
MAVEKSYARLGFFLVVALAVLITSALFFIQRMKAREVIDMVTYTTDNVAGLDIGSPVRFRGVPVGRVTELRIDPRGSLIEVDFELFLDRLLAQGANVERIKQQAATGSFSAFRAQTVANPVTGEAYLLVDIPRNPTPAMTLSFTPSRVYMPSTPSMIGTVQDRLPALMDRAVATLQTLEHIVARIPGSLDRGDRFFSNVERVIKESQLPAFSADSRRFFQTAASQMGQIASDLDRALGPEGTLENFVEDTHASINAANLAATTASTRDAMKSTSDAMNQTSLAADDLRRSLPAIRDALAQVRELARLLETQPESVVYGPRLPKEKR